MATLYVVATPIGNLEDITLRALRILNEVDVVLCEDTRVTRKLLSHYGIPTPTESYHAHSTAKKTQKIIGLLREGKNLALVTDAGTPSISDPGTMLLRDVLESDVGASIVSIPGPSALSAALSISGLPASDFIFLGFLPHKKGREKFFHEIASAKQTVVFYESPHRIVKTLQSLVGVVDSTRMVVVLRELTKIHEEAVRGSAADVLRYFTSHKEKVRGEFVVAVGT